MTTYDGNKSSGKPRWPFAVRAGLSTGLSIWIGYLAGDLSLGLLATIGAFTSLYVPNQTYIRRAAIMAMIAVSLAVTVCLGLLTRENPFLAVSLIIFISAAATFMANAFRLGPPGSYMLSLACASATAMPQTLPILQTGLLVLAGGMISVIIHLATAFKGILETAESSEGLSSTKSGYASIFDVYRSLQQIAASGASSAARTSMRVAVAVAISGFIAVGFSLNHAY